MGIEDGKVRYGDDTYWIEDGTLIKNGVPAEDFSGFGIVRIALADEKLYAVLEYDETWMLVDSSLSKEEEQAVLFADYDASANEQAVFDFAVNTMGVNVAAACGIVANIYAESSFNPNASSIEKDGRTSYGICQWNNDRLTALKSFCSSRGLDYTTLNAQLQYLQSELTGSEKSAFNKVKDVENTADGAYNAGYRWAQWFERCASKYFDGRAVRARDVYWAKYGESGATLMVASGWQFPMKDHYHTWGYESWGGNCTNWGRDNGGGRNYHIAIDINSKTDSNVYACSAGTVKKSDYSSGNGNFVIIEHTVSGKTVYSFYAHLSSRSVSDGASVSAGTKIGVVGHTGTGE